MCIARVALFFLGCEVGRRVGGGVEMEGLMDWGLVDWGVWRSFLP